MNGFSGYMQTMTSTKIIVLKRLMLIRVMICLMAIIMDVSVDMVVAMVVVVCRGANCVCERTPARGLIAHHYCRSWVSCSGRSTRPKGHSHLLSTCHVLPDPVNLVDTYTIVAVRDDLAHWAEKVA